MVNSKIWYREGPASVKFGSIMIPATIELKTLEERVIYGSYPVGFIVPPFLIAKIQGKEPSETLLLKINLIGQFLTGVCIFIILWFASPYLPVPIRWLQSLLGAAFIFYLPSALYWMQNLYFTDTFVIFPFTLFILLELLEASDKYRVSRKILMALGIWTDYLFWLLLFLVFLNRSLRGRYGKVRSLKDYLIRFLKDFWPAFLAVGVFLLHSFYLGAVENIINVASFRTSPFEWSFQIMADFWNGYWRGVVANDFNFWGLCLLWASLGFTLLLWLLSFTRCSLAQKNGVSLGLIDTLFYFTVTPILTIYVLHKHSTFHAFTALKLCLTMAVAVTALSIGWPSFFRRWRDKIYSKIYAVAVGAALVAYLYFLCMVQPFYKNYFPPPSFELSEWGPLIDQHTGYNHLVFSSSLEYGVPWPPQFIAYAMKMTNKVQNWDDIQNFIKARSLEGQVKIAVIEKKESDPWKEIFAQKSKTVHQTANWTLYLLD